MESETIKNITITIEGFVGIVFSAFMMYSMFKTKKSVEKMADTAKEMSNTISNGLPILMQNMIPQNDTSLHLDVDLTDYELTGKISMCCNGNVLRHSSEAGEFFMCNLCKNQVSETGQLWD